MTINDILEESILLEKNKAKQIQKEKTDSVNKKKEVQDRPGRHREAEIIYKLCTGHKDVADYVDGFVKDIRVPGITMARCEAYVRKNFIDWSERKDKKLNYLEKRAKGYGFNPRKYRNQAPGASSGKSGHGKPEYKGRAFYFVSFANKAVKELYAEYKNKQEGKAKKVNRAIGRLKKDIANATK